MERVRIPDLTTERLLLRRWATEDAPFAFDLYSRWEVQRFLARSPRVMSEPAEAETLVRRLRRREDTHRAYRVVALADSGQAVGTVMLQPLPASGAAEPLRPSGDTEIGWHVLPEHWGRGYATEAAAALLRAGLDAGLPRVLAVTSPENTASQRVCERIGLTRLGPTGAYYNTTMELFERTA